MKSIWPVVAILLVLPMLGCRNRAAQELLERDLRLQEDKIYALQSKVDESQGMLDSLQHENESLRQSAVRRPPAESPPQTQLRDVPSRRRNGNETLLTPPEVQLPGEQAPPFRAPPEIQPPDPNIPEGQLPPPTVRPDSSSSSSLDSPATPNFELKLESSASTASLGPLAPAEEVVAAGEVMQITLNEKMTGGYEVDGQPGDDGVTVLIEPRTADGKLIENPGPISVVVMDPATSGEAGRIARWNFTDAEVAKRWRSSPQGKGWRFDLRWPNHTPMHGTLMLYVRYLKPDGTKLDVEGPVQIELPSSTPAVSRGPHPQAPRARDWTRATKPLPQPVPTQMRTTPLDSTDGPGLSSSSSESPLVILEDPSSPRRDPPAVPQTAVRGWSPYR